MAEIRATILIGILFAHFLTAAPGRTGAFATDDLGDKPALAQEKNDKLDKPRKKYKPKFTIGKETTYATGPVDKDGFIDYATALHERMRQGVTPENNANVLIWKAIGPHPQKLTMPAYFFDWLGMPAPPEQGDYFVDLARYMKEQLKVDTKESKEEFNDELDRAGKRAWTPKQYPHLAEWLKANEKPLALVVAASKRSHYYSPLAPGKSDEGQGVLFASPMPGVQKCREFGSALAARAMLRVGQGRNEEAWQDLLACHRLARHVARGPQFVDALVGVALEAIASEADLAFLERAELDAKRIKQCLRDLQLLPPMPALADTVDLGERFCLLDQIMMVNRYGLLYLEALSFIGENTPDPEKKLAHQLIMENLDLNPALRGINRWYDRVAANMRSRDPLRRARDLYELIDEVRERKPDFVDREKLAKLFLGTGEQKGKMIGDLLLVLMAPSVLNVQLAADRTEQIQRNLHLAFALAAYQRDHGRYPMNLDALAPKYLATIPEDLFTGKALVYRPSQNGYLLYSFGVNGRDDEGRYYEDEPPGDDPNVRMPLPKLRAKQ